MAGIFSNYITEIFDPQFREILLQLFTAILCGFIVGLERTYKGKPAGIRTNLLISMGACLFMIVSKHSSIIAANDGFPGSDPGRIAAQVVSGIGFLGAGTILRNRGLITGLTSAASIWVMAAVGLAAGLGLLKLAVFSSIIVVISIMSFGVIVQKLKMDRFQYLKMEVILKKEDVIFTIRDNLSAKNVVYSHENTEKMLGETHYNATLYFKGLIEKDLEDEIRKIKGVKSVIFLSQHVE